MCAFVYEYEHCVFVCVLVSMCVFSVRLPVYV